MWGSILRGFGTPNWHLLVTNKNNQKHINFWIDLLSILEPSWVPKSSQNPPKSVNQIGPEGVLGVLELTWYPKTLQEGFKAPKPPKSDLRDRFINDVFSFFAVLLMHVGYVFVQTFNKKPASWNKGSRNKHLRTKMFPAPRNAQSD